MSGIQEGEIVSGSKLKQEGWDREKRYDDFGNKEYAYIHPEENLQAVQVGTHKYQVCQQPFANRGSSY